MAQSIRSASCEVQQLGEMKHSLLSPGTPSAPLGMAVAPPTPTYLWIGCADSRLVPNQITGLPAGDIFIHRNVGNVVKASDPNCMSTLEYAINCLKVKHIIVCGHYSCAAVQAAMKMQAPLLGLLNYWIADIREAQNTHSEELKGLPSSQQLSRLCELNVIRQAFNVCTSPVVQAAWTKGQYLHIHAMIFDTKTGLLTRLAGPIASSVMDESGEAATATKDAPQGYPSPPLSDSGSSARLSRSSSSRRRRVATIIPKSVLAACKDSSEVETLHAMTRYLETCGCVPDVENLLGMGAKLGAREDLASTSKGLKELEAKYKKMMSELEELKAAKNMAEDAQEHLTQQAQWLMKEKSELVQRMAQREQLINNLQERLDFVQAECQQLKGGSPDALLEELRQLATTDPDTLTPEMVADMRILTSLASGELAREVCNSVSKLELSPYPSPSLHHSSHPSRSPAQDHSQSPPHYLSDSPDRHPPHSPTHDPAADAEQQPDAEDGTISIAAGQTLFARFLEDDQAVRSAAAIVLARAESAGLAAYAPGPHLAPSESGRSTTSTSVGLGEYRYLTVDDADRPSMRCPWTPTSSKSRSQCGDSMHSGSQCCSEQGNDLHHTNHAHRGNAAHRGVDAQRAEDMQKRHANVKGHVPPGEFAFDFRWEKGSARSEGGLSGMNGSMNGQANRRAELQGWGSQEGVVTVSDLPPMPALRLPLPGEMSPMSGVGMSMPVREEASTQVGAPTAQAPATSTAGPLTHRSVPASVARSGYTTPVDGATEVGFGDDTWGGPASPATLASLPHQPRHNLLQTLCEFLVERLQQCGVEKWGPGLLRRAGKPAVVVLVGLLWLAVPGRKRGRGGHNVRVERALALPAPAPASRIQEVVASEQELVLPEQETRAAVQEAQPAATQPTNEQIDVAHPVSSSPAPSSPTRAPEAPSPWPPASPTARMDWPGTLQAHAIDLVDLLERRVEDRLALATHASAPAARTLDATDLMGVDAWLLENGWDARWGCCDGADGESKFCTLKSARG